MITNAITTSDGVRLALYERGQGQNDFVFQHGLCGTSSQPAEVMPDLDDVRLLTLECRGHGASDAGDVTKFSIAQFADDLADMIATRNTPVVLGGISMGAAIALRLAVTHPRLVRALVLARPAWIIDNAPLNMKANALVGELLEKYDPDEAKAQFRISEIARLLAEEAPDNLQSLNGFFTRRPHDVTAQLLSRISADGPGVDQSALAQISVPTLVIGHADDIIHPRDYAETLAALIPNAKLEIITSKVRNKTQYIADFQTALSYFLKQVCHAQASTGLV